MDTILTLSYFVIFSMLGYLTRSGIQGLNTYPGAPFHGLVWAQVCGCAFMGFLQTENVMFPTDSTNKPLLLALTTGYCGSVTTFSSWMLEMFLGMGNIEPSYTRAKGDGFLSLVSIFSITLLMAFAALLYGKRVGSTTHLWTIKSHRLLRPFPAKTHTAVRIFLSLLAVCFYVGAALYTAFSTSYAHRKFGFGLVFSPIGALLRLYLSLWLNKSSAYLPWGTFAANILGTLILSIMFMIPRICHVSDISRSVLYGVQNGFCGALTTLSTFLNELHKLPDKKAYIYGALSVFVGYALVLIVDGSTAWGHGYTVEYL
ncbi:hypothetical protein SJAG_01973 [Schizosaccharomyces japonicus yFS275]|uniref:CRCB domain-containing protein n=1 Tax=Schizosaccharomyces japonicus (strain yFS275 / FY16936) TaxID=402676 RepID=B6JZD9_SCHJY|nr:hypothetical protein SJAG_01973 [Schizosaccharomyces japonicus yFS275]EEB06907.1 hypothetical protein SJAG_01973 [Schizosaccharomyces japonicus yFS275]